MDKGNSPDFEVVQGPQKDLESDRLVPGTTLGVIASCDEWRAGSLLC